MSTEDTPTFPPLTQIPPDGIYRVMNASTGTFLDMRGGLSAENNPVVGWAGNEESKNQQVCSYVLYAICLLTAAINLVS